MASSSAASHSGDGSSDDVVALPELAIWGNLTIYVAAWALLMWPQHLPLGRPGIAVVFAAMACGLRALCIVLWPEEHYAPLDLFGKIEITPLALLFGLMLVNSYVKDTGLWNRVEDLLDSTSPRRMLVKICVCSAVMSAVLLNDTTCFVLTPVVLNLCAKRRARCNLPFLFALSTSSNIGSSLTIIGNPQNALIAVTCPSITFINFMRVMFAPVCAGLVLNTLALMLHYHSTLEFEPSLDDHDDDCEKSESHTDGIYTSMGRLDAGTIDSEVSDHLITQKSGATWVFYSGSVALLLAAMLAGWIAGLATDDVALGVGAAMMLVRALRRRFGEHPSEGTESEFGLAEVDYLLLLLFAGQFVLVGAMVDTGLPQKFFHYVLGPCTSELVGSSGCIFWFAALVLMLSNAIGNVPVILMLQPLLASQAPEDSHEVWVLCAWVATVAGNFTILGSAANLIVAHAAERQGELGFTATNMAKFSMLPTLTVICAGMALMPPVGTILTSDIALIAMVCSAPLVILILLKDTILGSLGLCMPSTISRESIGLFVLAAFSAAEGLGPFQMAWLTSNPMKSYSPDDLGILASVTQGLNMVLMPLCGMLVDFSHWKRALLGFGSLCVGASVAITVFVPQIFSLQLAIQIPMALGLTLVPVTLASLTSGTTQPEAFTAQVAINNVGTHAGTILSSAAMALSAAYGPKVELPDGGLVTGPVWSIVPLIMSVLTVAGLSLIRYSRIDHDRAAGVAPDSGQGDTKHLEQDTGGSAVPLYRRPLFWQLMALCFTFNFANMPQLMLLVQQASALMPDESINFTCAAQLLAHIGMTLSSMVVGRYADRIGRKPLLVIACTVVMVRALFTAVTEHFWISRGSSPWIGLVPCQGLDGVGAGMWLVLLVLLVRDVSAGSGRFNLAFGCAQAMFNAGAVASSIVAGLVADQHGFCLAYSVLACSGFIAVLQALIFPETSPLASGADPASKAPRKGSLASLAEELGPSAI